MWCLACFKPSTSEDPFEAEVNLALEVSQHEADIQEAKQLESAIQESSRLQKQQEEEEKSRTRELEKDEQIARACQYKEREKQLDNKNSALEDEKHEQPAKTVVESCKDKGKKIQFEEQVMKKDEELARILQESLNMVESPPNRTEERKSIPRRAASDVEEQLAKAVKESLKEKSKRKKSEEGKQVQKDEELALILQESLNMVESPPSRTESIPRRAASDVEEQLAKAVKESLKEKGKRKKSEEVKQVKKDEELALILQESLNMVEPPPRRTEECKSIPRRAALNVEEQLAKAVKESSKEKGKGKEIENEQVKKDEQFAVIVQESLNMVESPTELEEKSNISSSTAPMDEDEQQIIWESLKGKGQVTQSKDDVEDVGKLVEANPPRRCGGCYCEIEHGRSVDVLGVLWHPECLWCGACHNPIAIHEVENHVSNLRGKFHKNCYRRYCYVCQGKVKIRMFSEHPFWKEMYCPDHESDGTHKCFSCERLEPRGTTFVELDDGRRLCLECMASAIMDTYEVQPLHFEIREFFEGLNMKIEREFPFLLVEKQALNKAEEEEKIDNQHGVVTRGICLSEEQIVTSVSKGPKLGPNKQLIGMATESQRVVSECEVTAILILYGLPRLLTGYILAHEMMHAYLRLNGYRNLNKVIEEGICQVLGHMWLETQRYAPIDVAAAASSSSSSSNASKKGEWSEFEKKLVEFYKYEIETDESAVYGDGFRKVNHMVTNSNLKDTLKEILRMG